MNATPTKFTKILIFAAGMAFPAVSHAAPAISVGDSLDIFFNGRVGIAYDDNLALDHVNKISDVRFNFVPGVEFAFGRGHTNADFRILWQEDFVRYSSESRFDVNNSTIVASGAYEGAKFEGSMRIAYLERQSNTNSVNIQGDLIQQDIFNVNLLGEWEITPKSSISVGIDHTDTDYKRFAASIIPDRERTAFPINFYHEMTPKLDFSVGYMYREVSVKAVGNNPGYNADDHRISMGLRGEFNPVLTGKVRVGYLERNFNTAQSSRSTLSASGELTWESSPKTRITTTILSDFGTGGSGETIERRGIDFNLVYTIDPLWSMNANAGYERASFSVSNRSDDLLNFGVGMSYQPNEYLNVRAGYRYTDNDSSVLASNYSRNLLHLTASLRY